MKIKSILCNYTLFVLFTVLTIFKLTDLFVLYFAFKMYMPAKKYFLKRQNKIFLIGQIVIESHSFLEY